jgi:hypothetical protein
MDVTADTGLRDAHHIQYVFELKVGTFQPEHSSRLNFYLAEVKLAFVTAKHTYA